MKLSPINLISYVISYIQPHLQIIIVYFPIFIHIIWTTW